MGKHQQNIGCSSFIDLIVSQVSSSSSVVSSTSTSTTVVTISVTRELERSKSNIESSIRVMVTFNFRIDRC